MQTEIRLTEDGSCTLHVPEIDECYHSVHGAVQESIHIFIDAGLRAFLFAGKPENLIRVLEIGFGTGLNALLTLSEAEKLKTAIHYTSLELYPLAAHDALQLNYPEMLHTDRRLFEKIHLLPWETAEEITPYFTLHKIKADFTAYEPREMFDVVYFDAFSPEKQPELWTEDGFGKIYASSGGGAVLTTYCAKGAVRRALQSVGYIVERLPGPPGKREILRGRKLIV